MQEAVYHGVPLLGIPLFADQDGNMAQAERLGHALTLELTEITEKLLLEKIHRMLNEKK
jgi:glucuronosyltransferase